MAQHRTHAFCPLIAAVKVQLQIIIARADRLGDLLPVGVKKGTDAKFARLDDGLCEVEQAHRRLLPFTAAIKAENPLLLF